jgi:hypothetical protein
VVYEENTLTHAKEDFSLLRIGWVHGIPISRF